MKICICGKGGSGKSTVVALLANAFQKLGKKVIIVDADESNASLYWMLGMERPPLPLLDLAGGKKAVQQKMLARFTKGETEPAMSIWARDQITSEAIPSEYIVQKEGRCMVATGKIHQSLEGCACPMGVVTREFLKKLSLAPNELALIDLDAGIEHFGRGVETSVDQVICVVEPSLESISLAGKIMYLTLTAGASFKGAILNKISTVEEKALLSAKLTELGVPILAALPHSKNIQSACLEGRPLNDFPAPAEAADILKALQLSGD